MIRVELPGHLRTLAGIAGPVEFEPETVTSARELLDALEARYPVLRGTIREHGTHKRRAYVRFFICKSDVSHEPMDSPLPSEVRNGQEAFIVIGAMSGG